MLAKIENSMKMVPFSVIIKPAHNDKSKKKQSLKTLRVKMQFKLLVNLSSSLKTVSQGISYKIFEFHLMI